VRKVLLLILFHLFAVNVFCQDTLPDRYYLIQKVDRDGVVMPEIEIKEITIIGVNRRAAARAYRQNERLVYNIKKVYPYAIIARERLSQVNSELESLSSENQRRRHLDEVEKKMFAEFKDELVKLTITQGKILDRKSVV
jgi:hypothetical protein